MNSHKRSKNHCLKQNLTRKGQSKFTCPCFVIYLNLQVSTQFVAIRLEFLGKSLLLTLALGWIKCQELQYQAKSGLLESISPTSGIYDFPLTTNRYHWWILLVVREKSCITDVWNPSSLYCSLAKTFFKICLLSLLSSLMTPMDNLKLDLKIERISLGHGGGCGCEY